MAVQTRTTALQNEIVRLYCRFIRDGQLANPQGQPVVEVLDSDGVTVLTSLYAQIETTGMYYVDWFIPKNLPLGQYYDKWTFQWDSASCVQEMSMIFDVHSFESYINFISTGVSYQITNRAAQLLNDLANNFIFEAQHIPIYWEQGMRVQQENQRKRVKNYYYFNISSSAPFAFEGDVYSVNGQQYTVFQSLENASTSSSSSLGITSSSITSQSSISPDLSFESTSSSSIDSKSSISPTSNSSESYSSSSSTPSSDSSTSSIDSLSSDSSSSIDSSSSSKIYSSNSSISSGFINMIVLTMVGHAAPPNNGVLTKVKGDGSSTLSYSGFDVKTSLFSTIYGFAYKNWNMDPKPLVRLNNRIIDDGWHADYEGKLYFDGLMAPEDSVNATYNFSYFSNEEMLSFLRLGLQMMNSVPPASQAYGSLESCPSIWDGGILLYAAVTALKRLIFGLNWQEKMIIFGDPEAARNAQAQFKDLYASYQELWTQFAKNVKTSKLPEIALSVTPEASLPGGRSRFFRYLYKSGSG